MQENNTLASPAYLLWVELVTRGATHSTHHRPGDEESAVHSIFTLFQTTRTLLAQNPDDAPFRELALHLLNVVLRPHTTRWHAWMVEAKDVSADGAERPMVFRDELVRRVFRTELRELQPSLVEMRAKLAALAGIQDWKEALSRQDQWLGWPIHAGIGSQIDFATSPTHQGDAARDLINQQEHAEILRRRHVLAGKNPETPPNGPLTNAVGLALSGGGIRSATYCLGIVQVLIQRRLFTQFDYLSTVSGGGYLGSFLSCSLGTNPTPDPQDVYEAATNPPFPQRNQTPESQIPPADQTIQQRLDDVFHRRESGTESGLIRHLRNNSKYLLNGGFATRLRIAGLLTSGILWNMLMVLPIPLFAALTANVLARNFDFWGQALPGAQEIIPWPGRMAPASLLLLASVFVGALAVLSVPLFQKIAHGAEPRSLRTKMARTVVAFALLFGVALFACAALYVQPALFYGYEKLRLAMSGTPGTLMTKVSSWIAPAVSGAGSVVLGILATTLKTQWPRLRTVAAQLFMLSGPLFFLLLYLMIGNRLGLCVASGPSLSWQWILGAAVGLTGWSLLVVNINTIAPHVYYRAKLCECYLTRRPTAARTKRRMWSRLLTGESTHLRTENLQQVPLTQLGSHLAAPYHLINTTLNLPASDNKELRGRNGDFFVISKYFCGAPTVGYVPTEHLEASDPHFDLGTAMAVSGAAASTSMGWKSLPNFRFLMTMLNVRLGYWLRWRSRVSSPGVPYFFREMLARMDERGAFLNLSDGGHQENLAVYELLRRRCKFIVCVDAGQEAGMECADLTRLQRYAEIDLGIRFAYGIADLSVQANGFSRASAVMVKILYPSNDDSKEPQLGWMLYIKLAVTGIEPVYVLDYRRENPDFPHQSTGDQLYDEAQFEAYRRLGECAADNLFRDELFPGGKSPRTIHDWFQGLTNNMLADNDPVFHTPHEAMAAGTTKNDVAALAAATATAEKSR